MKNTKKIGTLGELAIAKALVAQDFEVFTSVGDYSKTDIVALKGSRCIRLQIKTVSQLKNGVASINCGKYTPDNIDFVAMYVIENDSVAFIPIALVANSTFSLRFTEPKNGAEKNINRYEDFKNLPA